MRGATGIIVEHSRKRIRNWEEKRAQKKEKVFKAEEKDQIGAR